MFYTETINSYHKPSFFERVNKAFTIVGYSRAIGQLTRLGYHKEAENCLKLLKELKASN